MMKEIYPLHSCDTDTRKRSLAGCDLEEYLPDLVEFDLTEAEKIALLQTLWEIMKAFVEMGVDVGQADICGRIFEGCDPDENHTADDVKSSFTTATETESRKDRKETPT